MFLVELEATQKDNLYGGACYSHWCHSFFIADQQGDQSSSGEGPSPVRSGEEGGLAEGKGASTSEGECDSHCYSISS